jgi:PKD repeat protein
MRVFSSNGIVRKRLNMFPRLSSSVLAVLLLATSIGFYGCSQETPLEPNNQSETSTGNLDLIPGQFTTASAVRNQLTSTTTDLGSAGRDNNFGFGLVDADVATNIGPPPSQAPTANANGPYSGTAGNVVAFSSAGSSDADGTIVGYSWSFGDGGSSAAANPNYTYGAAGTYNVSLTVTDDQGATGSNTTTATITAAPPPPPAGEGFIISRNADLSTDDRSFTTGETMYMKMWSD